MASEPECTCVFWDEWDEHSAQITEAGYRDPDCPVHGEPESVEERLAGIAEDESESDPYISQAATDALAEIRRLEEENERLDKLHNEAMTDCNEASFCGIALVKQNRIARDGLERLRDKGCQSKYPPCRLKLHKDQWCFACIAIGTLKRMDAVSTKPKGGKP